MEPNKQQVDPTTKQLGSIVAAHETDGPKPPAASDTEGQNAPTLPLPSPDTTPVTGAPSDQDTADAGLAQRPDVTMHPENKTIKLPVPTSVLPALVIGILVLVLLLAVAALAFI